MTEAAAALDEATARVLAATALDDPASPGQLTVDGMKALIDRVQALNGPGPEMIRVTDAAVPGLAPEVRVRLLQPVPEPRGVMLFLGCGGWVAGTLDAWDCIARKLAERTSCTLALIEFRRLPEHRYPAAIDDVYGAATWLWQERAALGHHDVPHMILGEGMGATLSAVVAARARRDPNGPRLALQFLICPVTDALADPEASSTDTPLLTRSALNRFWDGYAPDAARRANPDISPLRMADFRGLPPTVVVTAELDPARAEGVAFAERLRQCGVAVAHRDYAGQVHCFFSILVLPLGERVFQHIVRAVRGYIGRFCGEAVPPPPDLSEWLNRIIK
jgi:acetyl esterase